MDRKQELLDAEEGAWEGFSTLIATVPADRYLEPVDDSGWTLKDIMWHLGCWTAEAARELERIRMGTYEERSWDDTDRFNAQILEEGRRQDLDTVRAEWAAARTKARHEWASLPEVTPAAEEWFFEIGPEHFDEHLPAVRAWLEGVA